MDTACVDHWSKFNFAYALDAKTASNVAGILNTHIFPYFGVPASGMKTPPWSDWLPRIVCKLDLVQILL